MNTYSHTKSIQIHTLVTLMRVDFSGNTCDQTHRIRSVAKEITFIGLNHQVDLIKLC